jgi:hypothetical protein
MLLLLLLLMCECQFGLTAFCGQRLSEAVLLAGGLAGG